MLNILNAFKKKEKETSDFLNVTPGKPRIMKTVQVERNATTLREQATAFNDWTFHIHDAVIKSKFGKID
jgi:transposase